MNLPRDIVIHHLRIFGVEAERGAGPGEVVIGGGSTIVRLLADGTTRRQGFRPVTLGGSPLRAVDGSNYPWGNLRTFNDMSIVNSDQHVVVDHARRCVWGWISTACGDVLEIGTDLAADLTLFRQGKEEAVLNRPKGALWGVAGERANYLFDDQLDLDQPYERQADWWIWTLRDALIRRRTVRTRDILPYGAAGAVVVTGDDDQASLGDYQGQSEKLGKIPITYFLHPLTKHSSGSIAKYPTANQVEWELHPDALEAPDRYGELFRQQAMWFRSLMGRPARLIRNHGFLNDGYWGHAQYWEKEEIIGSSNLPGVDGCILNGSLLPARLALNGRITPHWSILTTFGDGVFFALSWPGERALRAVDAMANNIVASGVPGILVFNLHPANHEVASAMYESVHRLIEDHGFAAMTLGAAIDWFSALDQGRMPLTGDDIVKPFSNTRKMTSFVRPTGRSAESIRYIRPLSHIWEWMRRRHRN